MATSKHILKPYSLYLSISFLFFSPITHTLSESEALLKLKQSFTNVDSLSSWDVGSDPCAPNTQWVGLICSNGVVIGLRLVGMGLSGKIDINALKELKGLRVISFEDDGFSGPLPEFNLLGPLRAIFLSGNQFSGEIPPEYFASMQSLKKLWLSDNNLTGNIPPSLSKLSLLIELHLENNQFSGTIPDLNIPKLTSLDFSNNKLEGEIPKTLSRFDASSFKGNLGLCGGNLGKECPKSPIPNNNNPETGPSQSNEDTKSRNGSGNSKVILVGSIIGGLILFSLLLLVIFRSKRKRDEEKNFDKLGKENVDDSEVEVTVTPVVNNKKVVDNSVPLKRTRTNSTRRGGGSGGGGVGELMIVNDEKGVFGLTDLMKAAAEVLGNGSVGSSYKALMTNGLAVVVKRTPAMNVKGKEDFDAHLRMLGRLKHINLLTPLAYHYRKDEKLLVCEHVPKGSLLYVLHGDRGQCHAELNWSARLKIVQGIARGLGFLHTQLASIDSPHGNLKSSNILLTPDYEPLLSDFGYSPLISPEHKAQALFAYKAPEALQSLPISHKNDVYCLGVVILEILTGKFPSQYLDNGKGTGIDIIQWVSSAISEEREIELLDPEIAISVNAQGEMKKLLHVGSTCTETNPELRIDMMEAIRRIEEVQLESGRTMNVLPSHRDGFGSGTSHGTNDSYGFSIS